MLKDKKTPALMAGVIIYCRLMDAVVTVDAVAAVGVAAKEDDVWLLHNAFLPALCDNGCFWRNNVSIFWDALRISFSPHAHDNEVACGDAGASVATAAKKHHC